MKEVVLRPYSISRRAILQFVAASAIAASSSIWGASASALDLQEIIRRNTEARGGAEALDRQQSVLMEVSIDEAGQKLKARYAASKAGLVRVDIYVNDKFVGAEGIDSAGVWTWGKNGPEPSVAEGAANALLHGAEDKLFGWHRFAERGHKMVALPTQTIDGVEYPIVEVRYATGHVSYFYVDPATWHTVRRRDERAFHPDVDQTRKRIETIYSDFRNVSGVIAPHEDVDIDLSTGSALARHTLVRREANPSLPPDFFDRKRTAPSDW